MKNNNITSKNMEMYSLRDRIVGTYGDIILSHNIDDAKRRVAYSLQSNPYRDDLELFALGFYCLDNGCVDPFEKPVFICNVSELYSEA